MAERGAASGAPGPGEGLAGGPGPTPPGFDDGTPRPLEGADARKPVPEEEDRGVRREVRRGAAPRGDPEEPDPS